MIQTILFDLDGTLLDTAPDLAFALNTLLQEEGRPALPFEQIRPVVSHGGRALVQLGFGVPESDPEFSRLRQRLLDLYHSHLARETRLFPGMPELLHWLQAHGLRWGVVTNKPAWLTEPLLQALDLFRQAACVVSGDTTANRKPHPEPMLQACRQAGNTAVECLYVGDAERDIQAGKNAGMRTITALYGYILESDRPADWGADACIRHPMELADWLEQNNRA